MGNDCTLQILAALFAAGILSRPSVRRPEPLPGAYVRVRVSFPARRQQRDGPLAACGTLPDHAPLLKLGKRPQIPEPLSSKRVRSCHAAPHAAPYAAGEPVHALYQEVAPIRGSLYLSMPLIKCIGVRLRARAVR